MNALNEIAEQGLLDDDDRRLFLSRRYPDLASTLLKIKRQDPNVARLSLFSGLADLFEGAWPRLGHIIGRSSYVTTVHIINLQLNVEEFCAGLQSNKSIKDLAMIGVNLGGDRLTNLIPFLRDNPSLERLTLEECNLGPDHINLLSCILLEREATLKSIFLHKNHLGDMDLESFVRALSENRNMSELRLSDTGIGLRSCISIASLLASPECTLQYISLGWNSLDDNAAIVLADSLAKNTTLSVLYLHSNNAIAASGWRAMLKLVCNSSSIESAVNSNHTLSTLWLGWHFPKSVGRALGKDDANLLRASLTVNENGNKNICARRKILWSHARGDLNIGDSSVPSGAVPGILEWIRDDSNRFGNTNLFQYHDPPLPKAKLDTMRLDSIYRIFRSKPDVCCGIKSDFSKKRKLPSI